MNKRLVPLTLLSILLACGGSATLWADDATVAEIKSLLEKSYVHGAFNELDPEAMKRGFHPGFAIFSAKGEELAKYPIADWVASTAERKASKDFDPAKNVWTHHFASVDVTGNAAAVKIELSRDGKLVYTDYLSLLKFDSGWRVSAKVYYRHPD